MGPGKVLAPFACREETCVAFIPVCPVGDLAAGDMKRVEIDARAIALYNVGGTFYATAAICTHAEADLTLGELDGCKVECPLHGARFDVTNGRVLTPPAFKKLKTYPVRSQDGHVEVDVDPD